MEIIEVIKRAIKIFSSTENSFIEKTEFNIAVIISKDQNEGFINIQNPRILKKILAYKITEFKGEIEIEGMMHIYTNIL